MTTATEAIRNFLSAKIRKEEHRGPDLVERYLRHSGRDCAMETQVNVSAAHGEPIAGKKSTFTDGVDTWFSFRIPKNAYDDPFFHDFTLRFPLDLYCDGIGSTGWDWQHRRSRWVGFDFDSIVGHASGIGVSPEVLDRVKEAATQLPYVQVRRSTGGSGLHLYVFFADDPLFNTSNHTEHAAIARAVLGIMSRDSGYDFQSNVDTCGGNMWIWHKKSAGTEGLSLLKDGYEFEPDLLPKNWRDHIPVINRSQTRVRIDGIANVELDPFEQLVSAHRRVELDETHKAVMDEITRLGYTCNFVSDHWLLQTHTCGFQDVLNRREEMKEREGVDLYGVFQTNSKGGHKQEANCFAFPLDHGGWKVIRFGQGVNEAPTWEQDGQGWTCCSFNVKPNLDVAARSKGGRKLNRGGYEFDSFEQAVEVAKLLKPDMEIEIDDTVRDRKAIVSRSKDGQMTIEVPKTGNGEARPKGEWNDSDKKSAWTQVFNIAAEPEKLEVADYDEVIRCLESPDGDPAGWAAKKKLGSWTKKPTSEIKMFLQYLGHSKPEAEQIIGLYAHHPWTLVARPFEPEYLPNRCWNRDAPQYRFQPSPRLDAQDADGEGETSQHPNWDMVLEHVGKELTQYLKDQEWAQQCGIRTGADYLRAIFASILREPFEPTPYLFLFGPENSGKSILHEAFELLVTKGVVKADRALTSQSDFNGELAGAIVCVVEEKDISKSPGAHAKIKDAVTSRKLSIRKMRMDSYMIANSTHWIQCANSPDNLIVSDGDTRVTMMYVEKPAVDIPKPLLIERLNQEAPQFMRTLMDLPLPPPTGRLRIPTVKTGHKEFAEQRTRSLLDHFITEHLFESVGELTLFSEFYEKFVLWLPEEERGGWSRIKVSRSLPMKFSSGTGNGNKTYVINASLTKPGPTPDGVKPYYISNGRIKRAA